MNLRRRQDAAAEAPPSTMATEQPPAATQPVSSSPPEPETPAPPSSTTPVAPQTTVVQAAPSPQTTTVREVVTQSASPTLIVQSVTVVSTASASVAPQTPSSAPVSTLSFAAVANLPASGESFSIISLSSGAESSPPTTSAGPTITSTPANGSSSDWRLGLIAGVPAVAVATIIVFCLLRLRKRKPVTPAVTVQKDGQSRFRVQRYSEAWTDHDGGEKDAESVYSMGTGEDGAASGSIYEELADNQLSPAPPRGALDRPTSRDSMQSVSSVGSAFFERATVATLSPASPAFRLHGQAL